MWGEDTYWSEYESHIWCYGCEEDIEYTPGYEIFPVSVAMALGITFDKIDLVSGERITFRRR